jgi:hypothetical protein
LQSTTTSTSPAPRRKESLKDLSAEEYLRHLIREAGPLPEIVFKTRNDIKSQLSEHGHNISNVFFKCMTAQSHYVWGDEEKSRFKDSWDQFNLYSEVSQSVKIYHIIPGNMAAPIAVAKMDTKAVGYFMEYVDGTYLSDMDDESFKRTAKNLEEVVIRMHNGGVGHGDLGLRNIIVSNNPSEIKLIDPLRTSLREPDDVLIDHDKTALNMILRIANSRFVD